MKTKKKKRGWLVQPRNDLWRKKYGIPADTGPELLHYRRRKMAAALEAKRPHEQRIVQRAKRLAAKAADKARKAELGKRLADRLGLSASAA
jgi:hypothetical protein